MNIKIQIFLFAIVLLSVSAFDKKSTFENFVHVRQDNICLDSIKMIQPEICKYYEQKCKDCYSVNYLTRCVQQCSSATASGTCLAKCGEFKGWCQDRYDVCNKCFTKWSECQCPEGLTLVRYDNGDRKCELEACKEGFWRDPLSKCTKCDPCDDKCKTCEGAKDNCPICKVPYCKIIKPDGKPTCVDKTTYRCPAGQSKQANGDCFDCVIKCADGTWPNPITGSCEPCKKGCQRCTTGPEVCPVCTPPYCPIDNTCVLSANYKCPAGTFKLKNSNDQCFSCVPCETCPENTWCDATTNTCNNVCPSPKFIWQKDCITECSTSGGKTLVSNELMFTKVETLAAANVEWNGWKSNVPLKVTKCGTEFLLGGYGGMGQKNQVEKTFNNLPSHQKLLLKFRLWEVDSWDASDSVLITFGTNTKKITKTSVEYNAGKQMCGGGWTDYVLSETWEVNHVGDSVTVKFSGSLDQGNTDESFGVSDLQLFALSDNVQSYKKCSTETGKCSCVPCEQCSKKTWCNAATKICDTCDVPKFIWNYKCLDKCENGLFKYVDANGVVKCVENCEIEKKGTFGEKPSYECKPCDKSCERCQAKADSCVFPCAIGYVYWNEQCLKECPLGHFSYGINDVNFLQCNKETETCACGKCDDSCGQCIGPKSDQCTKCSNPNDYLLNGDCMPACPTQHYYPDVSHKTCNCCHENCLECSGSGVDQCSACNTGSTLISKHICYRTRAFIKEYLTNNVPKTTPVATQEPLITALLAQKRANYY